MLVIRTSDGTIRWMDVSAALKKQSVGGKQAKHVVFDGERFDPVSIHTWRKRMLARARQESGAE